MQTLTQTPRLLVFSFLILSSCSLFTIAPSKRATAMASRISAALHRADLPDEFYDSLYECALAGDDFPRVSDFRKALEHELPDSPATIRSLGGLYELLTREVPRRLNENVTSSRDLLGILTAIEIGDARHEETARLQSEIKAYWNEIAGETGFRAAIIKAEGKPIPCRTHPLVCAGRKIMNTIYQSCNAADLPPVTAATPDLTGVRIVGLHENGIGNRRTIEDREKFLKSNYYLSRYHAPGPQCFDVTKEPPIYDYGGKPLATVGYDQTFDFFTDNGSGSPELGTDCSGFVYSALAVAGLKARAEGRLKGITVNGVSASMFMDPKGSGLDCFNFATFDRAHSLRPGDILASNGHVVFIDSVEKDPFGIADIKNESECKPENMHASQFRFTIMQSSPNKGGLGVQRTWAADFFDTMEGAMSKALREDAAIACRAKFHNAEVATAMTSASLIRHLNTAVCSGEPVRLAHEDCVSKCTVKPSQNRAQLF